MRHIEVAGVFCPLVDSLCTVHILKRKYDHTEKAGVSSIFFQSSAFVLLPNTIKIFLLATDCTIKPIQCLQTYNFGFIKHDS